VGTPAQGLDTHLKNQPAAAEHFVGTPAQGLDTHLKN
jgi:hypothetical protein